MAANDYIYGNGDCRFTQEVKVGDWVSVSSVPNTFVPVSEVIDDNTLGIAQAISGADFSLQTIKIRRASVMASDKTGNPLISVLGDPNGLTGTILIGQSVLSQELNGPYALGSGVNIADSNGINLWSPTIVNDTLSVVGAFTPNSISTTTLTVTGAAFKVIGNNVTVADTVTANALTTSTLTISGIGVTTPLNWSEPRATGIVPYSSMQLTSALTAADLSVNISVPPRAILPGQANQVLGVTSGSNIWTQTGSLISTLLDFAISVLPNGNVLVSGGDITNSGPGNYTSACQVYGYVTGTWSATGSISESVSRLTTTVLKNGLVLRVGGKGSGNASAVCQLYNTSTGVWSSTGSLTTARFGHTATLLANGKVLIAGGANSSFTGLTACELYDPTTGGCVATGSLSANRVGHTSTLLPNGNVLVTGGRANDSSGTTYATCLVYNPTTGLWSSTNSFLSNVARSGHCAVLLATGKVLVAGGLDGSASSLSSAILYDYASGTWSSTGSMLIPHYLFSMVVLSNGAALAMDGWSSGSFTTACDIYDASTGLWSSTTGTSPNNHAAGVNTTVCPLAVLLPNGKVLLAGGLQSSPFNSASSVCELYTPLSLEWKTLSGTTSQVGVTNSSGTVTLSLSTPVGTCTSSYALTSGDAAVFGSASNGPVYFTLPSSTNIGGKRYSAKKVDSSSNAVVVGTSVGNSLDGATASFLTSQYAKVTFVSDNNNNWYSI